jgi:hypothetical protein
MDIKNLDQLENFIIDNSFPLTDRFKVFSTTLKNFDIPVLVWVANDNEVIPKGDANDTLTQMLAVINDIRQSGTTTQRVQITVLESEKQRINIENEPIDIDFSE